MSGTARTRAHRNGERLRLLRPEPQRGRRVGGVVHGKVELEPWPLLLDDDRQPGDHRVAGPFRVKHDPAELEPSDFAGHDHVVEQEADGLARVPFLILERLLDRLTDRRAVEAVHPVEAGEDVRRVVHPSLAERQGQVFGEGMGKGSHGRRVNTAPVVVSTEKAQ
jgi:hypothetical protein